MTTTDMPTEAPRRLTRSRDGRILAGVCSGAGRYYDIDPVIPRVLLAVLAVFGGAGIAIYVFAWLLIPEDGSPSTRVERWLERRGGDRGRDLLIVLVVLLALWFLVDTHPLAHRVSGAAILVVGVMVVTVLAGRHRFGRPDSRPPQPEGRYQMGGTTYGPPAAPGYTYSSAPTDVWQQAAAPEPPVRSWLPWLTFGVTILVGGSFGVAGAAGWAHPQPVDILTACVAVVGLGVLVGTFVGRAWSMIPLGLLLTAGLFIANALPSGLTWSAGNRYWQPTQASNHEPYVLGAGDATLDLRRLPQGITNIVTSRIGAGRLVVTVPRSATVNLHASTSAGQIDVFGREQNGTGIAVDRQFLSSAKPSTTINLNVAMGYGDVTVEHYDEENAFIGSRPSLKPRHAPPASPAPTTKPARQSQPTSGGHK